MLDKVRKESDSSQNHENEGKVNLSREAQESTPPKESRLPAAAMAFLPNLVISVKHDFTPQTKDDHDKFDHEDKNHHKEPAKSESDKGLNWRGKDISLKICDGTPSLFRDENGKEWESSDGKSWVRKDSHGRDAWQGSISVDAKTGEIKLQNSYGLSTTYKADGSLSTSFTTNDGKQVSQIKNQDGSQQIIDDGKVWQSADGKTWTSGNETRKAEMQVDEFGRLRSKDDKGNEKTERQSAELSSINDRMSQLQTKFNINFGEAGTQIEEKDSKKLLDLRPPTAAELNVLENALTKFAHLARKNGTDFEGLKFHFISAKGNGTGVSEHGWQAGDEKPPGIYIGPRDAAKTSGWDGFEGTVLHEITHQLQERWKNDVPKKIEQFFGFERTAEKKDDETTYRIKDSTGQRWQNAEVKKDGEQQELWMPVINGKVSKDPQKGISDEEMRARLPEQNRPSTNYFPHPQEAHAEAMAMLLFDAKMLWHANPNLFNATKKWDQEDINYRYGFTKGADGQQIPRMIRGVDRTLVANTPENRQQVKEWEENLKKAAATEKHAALPERGRCACHA